MTVGVYEDPAVIELVDAAARIWAVNATGGVPQPEDWERLLDAARNVPIREGEA